MSGRNKTKGDKLVFSFGEHDEELKDIILQIWNDGAESIFYGKEDFADFEGRIKRAIKNVKREQVMGE